MNIRTIVTLAVAVLLGLIAVFLVRGSNTSGTPAQAVAAKGSVPVVVATAPIARGEPMNVATLKVVAYPADVVPAGAFQRIADLTAAGQERRALGPIAANQPILETTVTGPGNRGGLAAVLAPGMRAIAVKSSDVSSVGGFALPGDRVDVLVTRSTGSDVTLDSLTQVLADNVRILGVDQDAETDKPMVSKAVTIEVTPQQAQAISLAQAVGNISLSLRSIADDTASDRMTTRVTDLGGSAPAKAQPTAVRTAPRRLAGAPRAASNTGEVRVTRGVETSGYTVAQY